MGLFTRIFDHEYKELKKFSSQADKIVALDEEMAKLSDDELKHKTEEFKERLEKGETLEDILIEAFAVAREAAYRVIGEKPFYVQVLGALAIHYGNIAEMKTGEGKTLTCVMPAYLNALEGKGVHIITVNEYLANRDADWMGGIHRFLGLTVGVNTRDMSPKEKQEAYNCDILYSTNNGIGFDYLRDNMAGSLDMLVQRPYNYAIIDEVDSILIDEARTPLIISGRLEKSAETYQLMAKVAPQLEKNVDYEEYAKSIAKLFIIDFYTLDNKLSKNDIGGTEFIKKDMRDNFIEEARSTFYKYVEVIDGRTQELPEVSSITDVSVEKTEFKYSDKTIDENAYKVSISWDYVEDLGYEKEASMIIVKQDKKLYIVEMD